MSTSQMENAGLGVLDTIVIVAVIALSSAVGLYYAYRSKRLKTTRSFLVASDEIGVVPLVLSTVATILSPIVIMGQPAESYSNGFQVGMASLAYFVGGLIMMGAVLPVFFQMNVATVNQYIEYRYNRILRIVPAFISLLQYSISMASLSHLTAVVLSDASGISYWASMAIICGTCALYTSVGGFTAVIWTDVLQAFVIFVSVGVLVIKGIIDVGGVTTIWNRSYEGNRTIMIRASSNNPTNYSFGALMVGGIVSGLGNAATNQSLLQRQMANKKLFQAKMTALLSNIVNTIVIVTMSFVGLIIYARYFDCDPLLNKEIRTRDQLPSHFAKDIFSHIDGLFGLYVAGILAATLSTLSSSVNAFSTIVIIDFIKPMWPDLQDNVTTILAKVFGLLYGAVIVAMTLVVKQFGSIKQLIHMLVGTSAGPSAGMFLLGFFFPWATSTGAACGYVSAVAFGCWAAIGRFRSVLPHYSLPVRTDGCAAKAFQIFNQSMISAGSNFTAASNQTSSFGVSHLMHNFTNHTLVTPQIKITDTIFGLYGLSPLWYFPMSVGTALIVGLVVSIATGIQDPETLDPRLTSPLTWFVLGLLPIKWRKWVGFKSDRFHGVMNLATISKCISGTGFTEKELEVLHPRMDADVYNHEAKELKT